MKSEIIKKRNLTIKKLLIDHYTIYEVRNVNL